MAKKPFKVLSSTALAAVFTASALVPTAAFAAETPAELAVASYVVTVDGANLSLTANEFKDLKAAGFVKGSDVKFVMANNGQVFNLKDFTDAKASISGAPTQDEVLAQLVKNDAAVDVEVFDAVIGDNGELTKGEPVETPEAPVETLLKDAKAAVDALPKVADVKVADKAAVAAAKVKVMDAKAAGADTATLEATIASLEAKIVELENAAMAPTVESVSAINAKTIEVKFNKAVDTSKATVELLRGTFKQNVTLNWSEDKTSVQLVGASNFQAADYTVNVSGLTEEALSGTVKIEAQKVASIEILDDVAVVDTAVVAGVFAPGTKATVSYVVKDQYGTDITKTTNLSTNDALNTTIKAVSAKGVIELSGAVVEGKKINDLVPVVLIDASTGTSVSKTVKLSATSTVSSIDVAGIYNAKGEEVALNDKSKASDAYIVLDLKDQYGKKITETAQAAGLVITNTNSTNLTIPTSVSKVKIGDKDELVIPISAILKAGNTDVLLISTTNGQSFKYTVQVAETSTTDAITVSQPDIAVAGESTLIPLTVTDKAGNVITDKKLLSDANKGIKVGGVTVAESALEVKDGQVYYKSTLAAGTQALVFQTSSFKVATLTVDVKAAAVATVVRGLKTPLVLSTQQGPVTLTAANNLVIEDQYGREMKNASNPVTVSLVGTSTVVSVNGANQVTPLKNGKATLKIALVTENGTIDSAVEVPVQVTDGTEYASYEIDTIGKTEVGQAKAFTVNGLLNSGKVALQANEYTATLSGGKIVGSRSVTTPLTVAASELDTDAAGTKLDTEFTLKVTVNATGEVLEQKFVVSPDAAKTQEFFFTSSATSVAHKDAKTITEATIVSGSTVANLKSTGNTPATVNVATVDQYGTKVVKAIPGTATVTIVPEKVADVVITDNGKTSAKVGLKAGVEEANVTYKVTIDGVTHDIKVKVSATAVNPTLADPIQLSETVTRTLANAGSAANKTYTSSNEAVATVTNAGVVKGLTAGTTTINYVGKDATGAVVETGSLTVTVHAAAVVGAVPVVGAPATTNATGATPTGFTAPQSGETITWSVANGTGSATIDSATGEVTGVSAGTVNVSYKVVNTATGKVVAKSAPVVVTIP